MVGDPLAVTATPTVHMADGGGSVLSPIAFAVLAVLSSVGAVLVLRRRAVRSPWSLHLLLVPVVPAVLVYAASVVVYGTLDTYPVVLPFALSVGGATLVGSSLPARRRDQFLVGTVVFVLPLVVGPLLMGLGRIVVTYLLLGTALGTVAAIAGYLVGRWAARRDV